MPKIVVTLSPKLPMIWLIILGVTVNINRHFVMPFLRTNLGKMNLSVGSNW